MPNSDELRIIERMDDQQKISVTHEQRISQVESRITTVEVQLPYMQNALTKLTDIVDKQSTQGALTEQAIVTLKEGQEQHRQTIEELTKGHMKIAGRVNVLWSGIAGTLVAVGGAAALVVLEYVFAHFLPK